MAVELVAGLAVTGQPITVPSLLNLEDAKSAKLIVGRPRFFFCAPGGLRGFTEAFLRVTEFPSTADLGGRAADKLSEEETLMPASGQGVQVGKASASVIAGEACPRELT
jgi:hypothetical protein